MTSRAPSKSNLARLANYGLSPATIATVFDLDVDRVRLALVEQGVVNEVRGDEDLRIGVQRVAWRDEGSPQAKQKLVTNLFSKMMGMLEQEAVDEMSGLREELTTLVAEMSTSAPIVDKPQQDVDDDDPT